MSGNWSYSTAFYPGESRFSSIFATRVQQAMGLDPSNGGKFQITSYPSGKGQLHVISTSSRSFMSRQSSCSESVHARGCPKMLQGCPRNMTNVDLVLHRIVQPGRIARMPLYFSTPCRSGDLRHDTVRCRRSGSDVFNTL